MLGQLKRTAKTLPVYATILIPWSSPVPSHVTRKSLTPTTTSIIPLLLLCSNPYITPTQKVCPSSGTHTSIASRLPWKPDTLPTPQAFHARVYSQAITVAALGATALGMPAALSIAPSYYVSVLSDRHES
jgi:hypothetical protein